MSTTTGPVSALTFAQQVGDWMRAEREALGCSQEEIAQVLGVADSTVSNYERGETVMSLFSHTVLRDYFKREHCNRGITALKATP